MCASAMRRAESEPSLLVTQRHLFGNHAAQSIPGYAGFVPGRRNEVHEGTFRPHASDVRASRSSRAIGAFDPPQLQLSRARTRVAKPETPLVRSGDYDARGVGHPAAGDVFDSRIPHSREALHSRTLGVTSLCYERRGGGDRLGRYGNAVKGLPGYTGHIPGKIAENVHADTWSKSNENAVSSHILSRRAAPRVSSILTEGHTAVPAVPADMFPEVPLVNNSYQDHVRGWSDCEYSGTQVDPAGRLAPCGRQEDFGCKAPPLRGAMHGYAGYVPGRVSENVVGERQCKTNHVAELLTKKNKLRITQR